MSKVNVRKTTGTLYFDFTFQGRRHREQTTLKDTQANRRKMEKVLERIELAIIDGTFEYEKFFPNSAKSARAGEGSINKALGKRVVGRPTSSPAPAEAYTRNTPTFCEFSETWFAECSANWRVNTQKANRSHLKRYLHPKFGDRQVHTILKADLLGFRAELCKEGGGPKGRTLSAKTVNEIMGVLFAILKEAAFRHEFTHPGETIKRLRVQKTHVEPLSLEEVERFLGVIRDDYYNYFVVRFFTGMRSGEVHGLKWEFVDFDRREILVRESITNGRVEYTKNDGSQREIHMSQPVFEALSRQRSATGNFCEYVFCTNQGTPLDTKNVNARIWKPTLTLLGLKERRLYQTRHTAATLWLASGEAPEWISRQLGHTSTEMLFKTYSRYVPNLTRQDGSAFEQMLAAKGSSQSTPRTVFLVRNRRKVESQLSRLPSAIDKSKERPDV